MIQSYRSSRRGLFAALLTLMFVLASMLGTSTPTSAHTTTWTIEREGDAGPNVKTIQHLLRQRGSTIVADGDFGPATKSAVISFQSANGLVADGIVGPNTWSKLVVTVDVGSSGEAVRGLQVQLNKNGYTSIVVDGAYGSATSNAVTDFKSKHALTGGTTVGPTTWEHLVGSSSTGGTGGYSLPIAKSVLPRSEYDDPHHDYPAIDLPVSTGTAVYATRGGTATRLSGSSCGNGYSVAGNDGATYTYCHLNSFVAANGTVNTGQLLGYSGNTGNSTGPHLHFAIKYGGVSRCPQNMLLAIYDGTTVPSPSSLPTSGCTY
ncbi:MAG TPA: peptidoglycan-binding protein [Herpetosiphonaceae bacterium]